MDTQTFSKKPSPKLPREYAMRADAVFKMRVPVRIFKGESAYVAHCPIFNVVSQGKSESEARKNITEALSLFIETCYSNGTLATVLKQSGFKKATGVVFRDKDPCLGKDQKLITVPMSLLIQQNSRLQECQSA
jgi:predicted RNase H-like HicB family nuclease